MKDAAIPLGKQLVALEKKLNAAFANGSVDPNDLQQRLNKIANVTAQLRYVHLVAHLQTPAILTEQQLHKYNQLRGYHASDPCANVPPGHDAKMWKQHNGCS